MFDWNPLFCSFPDSGFRFMIVVMYVFYSMSHILFWWQILLAKTHFRKKNRTSTCCHGIPASIFIMASEVWKDVEPGQLASAFQKDPPDGPTEYGQILQKLEKNIFPGALSALGMWIYIAFFFEGWQCHSYFVVWKMVVVTVSSLFSGQYEKFRSWLKVSRCLPLVQLL